jgi:hypothetical protein
MLWDQFLQRCRQAGRELAGAVRLNSESRFGTLPDGRGSGLTSSRAALETMHAGLVQTGDTTAVADLLQLRGLTDRMDCDLFLRFTGEELTGSLGTRVVQLCEIVDRTVQRIVTSQIADTRNFKSSGGKHGMYSQNFHIGDAGCRLCFFPTGWSKYGHPLWIELVGDQRKQVALNAKVAALVIEFPRRFFSDEKGAWFALEIPIGVELNEVIDNLIRQIRRVAVLLEKPT